MLLFVFRNYLNMRIAYAWLLLVITLSNWIGGFLYVEISEYIEVKHQMNAVEQMLALQVQQSIGTESTVKMLDPQPRLKGDVYGDGAFATEIDGENVFYTLLDRETDLQKVTTSHSNPSHSDSKHTILIKSLFCEFEVLKPDFLLSSVLTPSQTTFYILAFENLGFPTILTPPPNFS